jgi:hypothetical protein
MEYQMTNLQWNDSLDTLIAGIRPEAFQHSTLCLVRSATQDSIEGSFDFGETWDILPVSELIATCIVKDVLLPKAIYQLVRLVLKKEHPTIELAALSAQIRYIQANSQCSCFATSTTASANSVNSLSTTSPRCEEESGCSFWGCLYWATFLR